MKHKWWWITKEKNGHTQHDSLSFHVIATNNVTSASSNWINGSKMMDKCCLRWRRFWKDQPLIDVTMKFPQRTNCCWLMDMTFRIIWNVRSDGTETDDSNCTLKTDQRWSMRKAVLVEFLTRRNISKCDNNWQRLRHNLSERPHRQFHWSRPFQNRWHRGTKYLDEREREREERYSISKGRWKTNRTVDSWVELIDEKTSHFQITLVLGFPSFGLFWTRRNS